MGARLRHGRPLRKRRASWAIFCSEWALAAAVVLLETFRTRRVLWRYPPRLLDWIHSLGVSSICVNSAGPNAGAAATLGALSDLADQLPDTEAFRKRLGARSTDRWDREGWIWASLEVDDDGTRAKVAEDLRPFDLPYTTDILEARGYGPARVGWVAVVSAARSPRYPSTATSPTWPSTNSTTFPRTVSRRGWRASWLVTPGNSAAKPRGPC